MVVLLNPDTIVWPGWLERMAALALMKGVGAVGPLSDRVAGRQFVGFHLPPHVRKQKPEEIAKTVQWMHAGAAEETKLLIGFCLMVPRGVFDQAGMLDEDLFLGSDDLELSWRLRLRGYRLLIAKDVYIQHLENSGFRSLDPHRSSVLLSDSTQALKRTLTAHYGNLVPPSSEIWGIDILPENSS